MNILDFFFIMGLFTMIGIFLIKFYNVMTWGNAINIKVSHVLFAINVFAYLFVLVPLFQGHTDAFVVLSYIGTFITILTLLFWFFEIIFAYAINGEYFNTEGLSPEITRPVLGERQFGRQIRVVNPSPRVR